MKISVIALLALIAPAIMLPVAPVFAEGNAYFIELGNDTGDKDARKTWEDMVAKHKKLLGGLKFYPKSIIHGGSSVGTRIQAGPIAGKSKAQATCTKLFAAKVPCFVIEGQGDAPPTSVVNLTEKAAEKPVQVAALPWLVGGGAPSTAPAQSNSEVMVRVLPELKESPKPVEPPVPTLMTIMGIKRLGGNSNDDEVANVPAPVPVAINENTSPAPAAENAVAGKENPAPAPALENTTGWLTVEAFANADAANAFWQEVRKAMPERAAGLGVHILKPLMLSKNQPVTSLSIGPFASSIDAYTFCRDGIQARDKALLCRFKTEEPAGDTLQPAPAPAAR